MRLEFILIISYDGVANLGIRPTIEGEEELLEIHIFDFNDDIYGLKVEFVEFIREEKKFESLDELKQQIELDSKKAQEILS